MKEKLIEICKNHILPADIEVVIREPYIPHIPSDWNGILVLAESQSLPAGDEDYTNYLRGISSDERIDRLNLDENSIGVGPWNDGFLKLALESVCAGESSERTAVSNAALWSQRKDDGSNENPDDNVQQHSSVIWKAMLEVMKPKLVICSGKVAESIIHATDWAGKKINWLHPDGLRWTPTGKLDHQEVLTRYPEVRKALEKGKFEDAKRRVLFACDCVSRTIDSDDTGSYRAK